MRIINISFVLLLVLYNFKSSFEMAVIKGAETEVPESQDCSGGETAPIPTAPAPEATDVRSKKPETDSLNDVAEPQVPEDPEGTLSPIPITPKMKRCAIRTDTLGSPDGETILSMSRRDVSGLRAQQCQICLNKKICKERGMCKHCNTFCKDVPSTTTAPESITKRETVSETQEPEETVVLGSRLAPTSEENSKPRYYSLGSVEPGSLMSLFEKIFNIPDNFEKLLILGQMKQSADVQKVDEILIIDLAQVFGKEKKVVAAVDSHKNLNKIKMDLIEDLNRRIDEAIRKRVEETGEAHLGKDEIHELVDEAMKETNPSVGSPREETSPAPETEAQTRCDVDDAMEDLLHMMPKGGHVPEPYPRPHHHNENRPYEPAKPQVEYLNPESEESYEERIKNPSVIQDSFKIHGKDLTGYVDNSEETKKTDPKNNLVGNELLEGRFKDDNPKVVTDKTNNVVGADLEDGYVDDNEEARPSVITEFKVPKTKPALQEANRVTIPKEGEVLSRLAQTQSVPTSSNQISNEPNLQQTEENNNLIHDRKPQIPSEDLEKNVFKIVEDSLKAARDQINQPNNQESIIGEPVARSEDLEQNVLQTVEDSLKTATDGQNQNQDTDQNLGVSPEENIVGSPEGPLESIIGQQPPEAELENRGQFSSEESHEKSTYFGSLVPAKGVPPSVDPRVKKIFYVGKDINLPLKMFQDEDGVMKLRVDTDALCNCKNQNCTKKHVDDRIRGAMATNEEENDLPELQVRFERDHRDLMNSFVDSLHEHNENSEIFKRSAKVESEDAQQLNVDEEEIYETSELENKIDKLNEEMEKYDVANKKLLNKGTVAIFNDVEKTENINRMVTLANNLLLWMKAVAQEKLRS